MSTPSRRQGRHAAHGRAAAHPLSDLPRPLSEREFGQRRVTPARVAILAAASAVVIGGAMLVASIGGAPLDPVGDVAAVGASSAPTSAPATVVPAIPSPTVHRSPRPTPTPLPTATPVPTPPPLATLSGYISPLPRGRLTLPFGPSPWGSRVVDGEKFHDGMDLATFCGDRIVAAHDGIVLAAGRKYDRHMGWIGDIQPYLDRLDAKRLWMTLPIVVVIDDGNGYRSIYAHFRETVVKKGDVVKAGDLIGYEGQTGRASGCHLHYGLFSPLETASFEIDPVVVKRMKVPKLQIARVDPLVVLPMHAPKPKPTPSLTATPSASPSASPSPGPGASASALAGPDLPGLPSASP